MRRLPSGPRKGGTRFRAPAFAALCALAVSACSLSALRGGSGGAPIPPGCFSMGREGWKETEPVHRVCLDGFVLDRTEVTLAQYEKCVARKRCHPPEYFPEPPIPGDLREGEGGFDFLDLVIGWRYDPDDFWGKESIPGKRDRPVVGITWTDADRYCREMGKRLPTEAEWEYALLGGDSVFKDTALELANPLGWYAQNSGKQAHPVGRKTPNAFGLYDMLGNAAEYVQDLYSDSYYAVSPERNPQGPPAGKARPRDANTGIGPDGPGSYPGVTREMHVVKGGSWAYTFGPHFAFWRWSDTEHRSWWVGFRCAQSR